MINKNTLIILFFCISYNIFAQSIIIKGTITDISNRGIENASVTLLDSMNSFLAYDFTDDVGNFSFSLEKINKTIRIEISCLGYDKRSEIINFNNRTHNYILVDKNEILEEIVIESGKKINVKQDTTFIKVAAFINETEQTVEDILKKMPGIEVLEDGSIKAHGVAIDKLLIEGEDMLDKNYKLLSKNLDAKVLDEVQIIDNFEDNPIFKKLNSSDKVAINLKLKDNLKNVWFGNVTLGSGIVTENRWKESLNLGLLKKSIKLLYFTDYNNLGEKATDLINNDVSTYSPFSNERIIYKSKNIHNITNLKTFTFSKTQSTFNNALANSLSFSTKPKSNLTIRGVVYYTYDKQHQKSNSITSYNTENEIIKFNEDNFFLDHKKLSSSELELKYAPNDKNFITNYFILKSNPNKVANEILFNDTEINQKTNTINQTLYNHFNHTKQLSQSVLLNNYVYLGKDNKTEKLSIISPFLNSFLDNKSNEINEDVKNQLFYIGTKSKFISKINKFDFVNSLQIEYYKEYYKNNFIVNNINNNDYENNIFLKQLKFIQENTIKYNFTRNINISSNINLNKIDYNSTNFHKNTFFINPSISINVKKSSLGNFTLSYLKNNFLPEINQLTNNYQITNYRNFYRGTYFNNPLKNETINLSHSFFNDEKRFSINTYAFYSNVKSTLNTINNISNDFNFSSYTQTKGNDIYNLTFSISNYFRKLKLASKFEVVNNWIQSPVQVNSSYFQNAKNYNYSIKYSGTTYFTSSINLDFGFSYLHMQSNFLDKKTSNNTSDYFLNLIYKISNIILLESNNSMYYVNKQNYIFNNIVLNINPTQSRFSFRVILNNLANENQYTNIEINNYTYYQVKTELIPRYVLGTVKYRF